MFGFLGDLAKGVGKVVGTVVGTIVGVPLIVVSEALGISVKMVIEAKNAGCETYDEIKDFFDLK